MTSHSLPGHEGPGSDPSVVLGGPSQADRLRFAGFEFRKLPSGIGSAQVALEWHDGRRFTGRADGVSSSWADLRLAVEATLKAIAEFTQHSDVFELVGVKALRAFDTNVIMVSVMGRRDGKATQLVGCRIAEGDPLQSAVLATLQATNRLLGAGHD